MLNPGEEVTVMTGIFLGIGKVTIQVSIDRGCWIWNLEAFLLGPLMILFDTTNEKSGDLFMNDFL